MGVKLKGDKEFKRPEDLLTLPWDSVKAKVALTPERIEEIKKETAKATVNAQAVFDKLIADGRIRESNGKYRRAN